MTGTGITQINGTMTVDFTDLAEDSNMLTLARTARNSGTINLVGGDSDLFLSVGGTDSAGSLSNSGQLIFNTTSTSSTLTLVCLAQGTLTNNNQIMIRGGGNAGIAGGLGGDAQPTSAQFLNYGSIETVSGFLRFTVGFTNFGDFTADAGTSMTFGAGNFVFNTILGDLEMGGPGTYVVNDAGANIIIPSGEVDASNFYLQNGKLSGEGTFSADFFGWSGGEMTDEGETLVESGCQMVISGSVTLSDGRTLRVQGTANWAYDYSQTIAMTGSAILLVDDGGQFVTDTINGAISSDGSNTQVQVIPGGSFQRNGTEEPGTISIAPAFFNYGGTTNFSGNTVFSTYFQDIGSATSLFGYSGAYQFNSGFENGGGTANFLGDTDFYSSFVQGGEYTFGGFSQSNGLATTNFGNARYVGVKEVDGGTITLQGGKLESQLTLTDAAFQGFGLVGRLSAVCATIELTGNLGIRSRFDASGGTLTYLNGYTLTLGGGGENGAGCTIYYQGGRIAGAAFVNLGNSFP